MRTLSDKVVVITGAGSGIGRALAVRVANEGARLALSDISATGLAETAAMIRQRRGVELRTDQLDVRDRQAMAAYAASVAAEFGTVNVVINNAGVGFYGFLDEMTYEQFEWVMDIDFWGVVYGTKEFLPYLIASGDGHIVNLSSMDGLVGMAGQTQYCAAKFAVRGFSEALRQEMMISGHRVEVTTVHPGSIQTPIARNAGIAGNRDRDHHAEFFEKYMAMTSAEHVADRIINGILKKKPRVVVGLDAKALDVLSRIAGAGYQRAFAAITKLGNKKLAKSSTPPRAGDSHR
ncbi:SDR family NAD(P)-dependent oxidoreductase [Nocardia sp. NPDC056611]|uniref:SDR family NAD(P)-dependent oxidoreductase n=1 Tax=Nocardia sp. NPDC056611 TaxID=3345877 RepID=UPI00366CF482